MNTNSVIGASRNASHAGGGSVMEEVRQPEFARRQSEGELSFGADDYEQ